MEKDSFIQKFLIVILIITLLSPIYVPLAEANSSEKLEIENRKLHAELNNDASWIPFFYNAGPITVKVFPPTSTTTPTTVMDGVWSMYVPWKPYSESRAVNPYLNNYSDAHFDQIVRTVRAVSNAGPTARLFNGSEPYVLDQASELEILVDNLGGGADPPAQMYIRDIADMSGAFAGFVGNGSSGEVHVYTSSWPGAKFESQPTTAAAGTSINPHIYAEAHALVGHNPTSPEVNDPNFRRQNISLFTFEVTHQYTEGGTTRTDVVGTNRTVSPSTNFARGLITDRQDMPAATIREGTNTFELRVTDRRGRLTTETITINGTGGSETPTPPPPANGGSCAAVISSPSPGQQLSGNVMNPNATGVIRADSRGNERFDVSQGIPTSESLYANAFGLNYLFQNRFSQMSGQVTYTVTVTKTYELVWEEPQPDDCSTDAEGNETCTPVPPVPMSETVTVSEDYTVTRPYSYWLIDNLEVNGIDRATMSNYALPNGNITITPSGYSPPSVDAANSDNVNDHVFPAECEAVDLGSETIDGGTSQPSAPSENFQSEAEGAVGQNEVKNDRVIFNNQTIMNDSRVKENGPTPVSIPVPSQINQNVLYRSNMMIDSNKVNQANTSSSGTIFYNLVAGIKGGSNQSYPINGINSVTVHTPVVIYSNVSDDKEHNQRTTPNMNRRAVILDRPFSINLPTNGQHRNILGYGNRDYAKYVQTKQVQFPFDVYNESKTQFIPAGTWINVPVNQTKVDLYLPVWVEEGDYDVQFRVIAENAPSNYSSQQNANLNLSNHAARETIPVDVVGRLYDFRVTDVVDYNWEDVFRMRKGSPRHTENYYWVGTKSIDGENRGNVAPFTLPMMVGSHPDIAKKNIGIKTGYHFKFDLKTKGSMYNEYDAIRMTPSFRFVDKNGQSAQEVDLYYHSNEKQFIRIGSDEDQVERFVILNDRLRNVPEADLANSVSYMYHHYNLPNSSQPFSQFLRNYLRNEMRQKTWVGTYDWMILPYQTRTFIGPTNVPPGASVSALQATASIQQWYGEYSLPSNVYAVPKGTNLASYARTNRLNDQSPVFLRDGYIIVNFNIESIRDRNINEPHLQYINAPLTNQWRREGFTSEKVDGNGAPMQLLDGDVLFYHGDQSSLDDFNPSGTH